MIPGVDRQHDVKCERTTSLQNKSRGGAKRKCDKAGCNRRHGAGRARRFAKRKRTNDEKTETAHGFGQLIRTSRATRLVQIVTCKNFAALKSQCLFCATTFWRTFRATKRDQDTRLPRSEAGALASLRIQNRSIRPQDGH